MIKKKITRADIAREAGVSVSVVSRALSNSGYVEKEKKARIIEIAERLGYMQNPLAMALRQRRTHQLLLFSEDLTGVYYNQMYHGIARQAEKRGYRIIAINDEINFEVVKTLLADGVLFCNEVTAKNYAETVGKNFHFPAVTACFDPACVFAKPMPMVLIDNGKVMDSAIDYLRKKGHRRIGMALPFNASYANIRYRHWKERMTLELGEQCMDYLLDVRGELLNKNGREPSREELVYDHEGFKYLDMFYLGQAAARMYKDTKNRATVIICFNDDMAFGMMEEFRRIGIRVPEDVSVMGIDGVFTRNRYEPKLTTMAIYPERQGAKCVDVLINMLEGINYKYVNHSSFRVLEGDSIKTI